MHVGHLFRVSRGEIFHSLSGYLESHWIKGIPSMVLEISKIKLPKYRTEIGANPWALGVMSEVMTQASSIGISSRRLKSF